MKTVFTFITLAFFLATNGLAQVSIYDDHQKVSEYEMYDVSAIKIPMHFAESGLIDLSQLKKLEGQTIHHVDLVYTSYKESEDFDQEKLNRQRIKQLRKLLPALKKVSPSWSYIEQTDASSRDEAKEFFHGFVIHYGASFSYQDQKNFFRDYQNPYNFKSVDNGQSSELHFEGGTVLHIPENAVCYEDGSPVKGDYQLFYREYRDVSDVILSGIPMTYEDGDTTRIFNSVGMFEIRGKKNGKNLKLQKDIKADFLVNESLPEVSFYEMSDDGEWKVNNPISFTNNITAPRNERPRSVGQSASVSFGSSANSLYNRMARTTIMVMEATVHTDPFEIKTDGSHQGWSEIKNGILPPKTHEIQLNDDGILKYEQMRSENDEFFKKAIIAVRPLTNSFLVKARDVNRFIESALGCSIDSLDKDASYSTLTYTFEQIPEDPDDKKVFGARKVMGLVVSNFAVYNCDQIGRLSASIAFNPMFIDKTSGKRIQGARTCYVVDMSINGALTFSPQRLVCNRYGRTKVIMFTNDLDVYIINQSDFAGTNFGDARPKLMMTDITKVLQQKGDLKSVFNI